MPINQSIKNFLKVSKSQLAFTLAETLITLGIIGIVAALTIPNLVTQYQKDQTVSQLKSVYSALNSAIDLAKVEYGTEVDNWYVPNDSATASTYFAEHYILPYLKTVKNCGISTDNKCLHSVGLISNLTSETKTYFSISGVSDFYSFVTPDGSIISIHFQGLNGTTLSKCRVFIYFDVNGKKPPDILGKDVFLVELGSGGDVSYKNKFLPYCYSYPREYLINGDDTSCNKESGNQGHRCFALIMNDGWKIADDYPW